MIWAGLAGALIGACVSVFGGGLVLLNDASGDAPAGADRDAGLFRPCPDAPAAVPAGCGPRRPTALSPPGLAGMTGERCELAAERRGVLGAQIDLILGAIHPEPHRLVCRAPSRSSWSSTVIFCAIAASWLRWGYLHRTRSTVMGAGTRGAASHLTGCTRPADRDQLSSAPARAARQVCPIANENRLVVPDTLGTTIKLTSSASRRGPLARRQRTTASGAGAVTYI